MKSIKIYFFLSLLITVLPIINHAQTQTVFVDQAGVMRWSSDKSEIQGFGVNYTVPFAHAYRSAKKSGIDPLQAIDQDVYHFARLGFDLYRVHVWDTEISDTLGNLLFNENLHAFDYLLKKLGERNINYVITPIAYWGGGWPEPDLQTPGFSHKYGKDNCLTNPLAIKAQENYLYQFLNHVNPYTGIAYKDDPRLIAVEISNEPHHRGTPEEVKTFIQRMIASVKKTGYKNPVFYNITHSVHLAETYFGAGIDGGTFQWYPTGLGYQQELPVNVLPNVDKYDIPFDDVIKKQQGAKIVYEFDAADIAKSYPYPAMARSFRTAGIQLATHFSYDPTFLADVNTEYNTHHMNLAYTPHKALSLMICSEIFHQIPMYKDFGTYPQNTSFDNFMVKYEGDLAMLNQADKYYYTNTTTLPPLAAGELQHIAGTGNSPIVRYDGAGAYFLDKLEDGAWRLEVMPDPVIVSNPYGRNSLAKKVALIQWNERKMEIQLADLGKAFYIYPINNGNSFEPKVDRGTFTVKPGAYILSRSEEPEWEEDDQMNQIQLGEFQAPAKSVEQAYFQHTPPQLATANEAIQFDVQYVSPDPGAKLKLMAMVGWDAHTFTMRQKEPFRYVVTLPAEYVKKGFLTYYFQVQNGNSTVTYPAGKAGKPFDWDFTDRNPYALRVIDKDQAITLFDAARDWQLVSRSRWLPAQQLMPLDHVSEAEFLQPVEQLFRPDNENLNGPKIYEYNLKHYLNPAIDPIRDHLAGKEKIVFKGRALYNSKEPLQIAIILQNGEAFGATIKLKKELAEYEIPLADLKPVPNVPMPRPYPTFLPYYFSPDSEPKFDITQAAGLLISLGPGIPKGLLAEKHGFSVVWVRLE